MVFHMKTTLNISDVVMDELKAEARRKGKTMSELVEVALRTMLAETPKSVPMESLPTFRGGTPRVDVANRDALYEEMEKG